MAELSKDFARISGQDNTELFGIGKPIFKEIIGVGDYTAAAIRSSLSLGHQILESYLVDPAQIFPYPKVVNDGTLAQMAAYNSKILNMMAELRIKADADLKELGEYVTNASMGVV